MSIPQLTAIKYTSIEGTLNDGSANTSISISPIRVAYNVEIINDDLDANGDFSVRFNTDTSALITVKKSETLSISDFEITAIYLTNSSGQNIAYRIRVFGI